MNDQLSKKFKRGDIVSGKVIEIEPSKALIEIEDCEPVHIIKEVASTQEIESIEEVLQLGKIYEFSIAIDYSARYYKYDEKYLSIAALEEFRSKKRLEQLARENVIVYTKVIQAFEYGVLVIVENKSFIISNIHLKTKTPNQELVETTIPCRVILVKKENYNYSDIVLSHRWAVSDNKHDLNNSNTIDRDNTSLIDNSITQQPYAFGDVVVGKVIKIEKDYALVDVSAEKPAYIALKNISLQAESCEQVLHLNLIREFRILVLYRDGSYTLALSSRNIDYEKGLKRVEQMQEEDVIFYPPSIKETGRGNGYIVRFEGVRAFLPANHLGNNITEKDVLEKKTPLQFLEFNQERYRIVVSNRKALATLRLKQLQVGNLITGKIFGIKEYGLFIRTDNLAVLLHISEVSQLSINSEDLNNIFKVNDEIKAIVVSVDIEKRRVAVSTKQLEVEPGDMLKDPQLVYKNAEKWQKNICVN
ncbi:MAG: S1 RNA-binding domain-containing protein [Cyanobacteria bacterium P01_G01_bin.67]